MKMKLIISMVAASLLTTAVNASELTFRFNNPSFGGNPANGSFLLNTANAQDDYDDGQIDVELSFGDQLLQATAADALANYLDALPAGASTKSVFLPTGERIDVETDGSGNVTITNYSTGDEVKFSY